MQLAASSLRSAQRSRVATGALVRSLSTSTAAGSPVAPASASGGASSRPAAPQRSFLSRHPKKVAVGVLALGGGAAYLSTQAASGAKAGSGNVAPPPPPFNLDDYRGLGSLESFKNAQDIVLYQYETCPFCNKVRAFLDYSGIRYRTVEVNPLTKAEKNVSPELKACKEVPVLVINGRILTDSTPIIKNLNDIMNLYRPQNEKHVISEDELSSLDFVDKRVVTLTAPNIYRTFGESLASFDYISRNSQLSSNSGWIKQTATKWVGATVMYLLAEKKLKKKYNITDARESMYQAIREWIAGNKGADFRGGSQPNLADITCFGVFRSLQNYATGDDVMNPANTSPEFVAWYKRVEQRVQQTTNKATQQA